MLTLAKWAAGVVAGGIALGAALGFAAKPEMTDPPEREWQLSGREGTASTSKPMLFEAPLEEPSRPGGFRPDLDYDAEVWAFPATDYESYDNAAEYDSFSSAGSSDDTSPGATPRMNYGTAAERAADKAEAAVDDALNAQEASANDGAEVRKSRLASAGLY